MPLLPKQLRLEASTVLRVIANVIARAPDDLFRTSLGWNIKQEYDSVHVTFNFNGSYLHIVAPIATAPVPQWFVRASSDAIGTLYWDAYGKDLRNTIDEAVAKLAASIKAVEG